MSFGGMWDQLVGAICRPPRCKCSDVVHFMSPLCPLVSELEILSAAPRSYGSNGVHQSYHAYDGPVSRPPVYVRQNS